MMFFLVFLLVMGIIVEFLSLHRGLKHIRFSYKPKASQAEQGELIPVTIQVDNTAVMPVSYLLAKVHFPFLAQLPEGVQVEKEQFQQTADLVFRFWGRQSRRRTIPVCIEKRGVHYLRGALLESTDFAGLRKTWDFYDQQEQILIYPRCCDDEYLISAMGEFYGDMVAQRHLLRDPILTAGIREYSGREPMKTISWTHTARRGQMMVREFDFTRDLSCTVILAADGMMPASAEKLDHCCSVVRTVCRELTDRGINVDFYTNSPIEGFGAKKTSLWKCTASKEDQQDLLQGLALLYPAPVGCPADVLAASAARAAGRATAFVVVAAFDSEPIRRSVRLLEEYSGMRVLLVRESELGGCTSDGGKQ